MSTKEAIAAGLIVAAAIFAGESRGAPSESPPAEKQASIPFVNFGSVRDWSADGSDALYVQDVRRQWYHVRLMGPCMDLSFTETIGIETRGPDTLDKFGSVIVRGQRCAIQSMVKSAAPPSKAKRHKRHADNVGQPGY